MNVTERATTSSTARAADARSPFMRLADLLAGIEPGQPVNQRREMVIDGTAVIKKVGL